MPVVRLGDVAERASAAPPLLGAVRLVCVDGPAGSGKTTLAARLARHLGGAPVVHLDDLYEGWDGLPTVGARLEAWLLLPWRAGLPGRHLRYDWERGAYAAWVEVPAASLVVLEGVGAGQARVRAAAALTVWVRAADEVRVARGVARDGEAMRPQWLRWLDQERAHFAADRTEQGADLLVEGDPRAPHDPEREVVATWTSRPGRAIPDETGGRSG